jgi:hypothetical protein
MEFRRQTNGDTGAGFMEKEVLNQCQLVNIVLNLRGVCSLLQAHMGNHSLSLRDELSLPAHHMSSPIDHRAPLEESPVEGDSLV